MRQHSIYEGNSQELARSATEVRHESMHPNSTRARESWGNEQTLHIAAVYSNPYRWDTRTRLFNNFRRHLEGLGNIRLYVGELAYGGRNFEVTSASNPDDFQIRTRDTLWHKENLINEVVKRFDPDWLYGGYIDGDAVFTRQDVGLETIEQLQHHEWVQMFSSYTDLSHDHKPMRILQSFASRLTEGQLEDAILSYYSGKPSEEYYGVVQPQKGGHIGTTGLAWAFRREAFVACGGLLDTCILGSGDWHMAFGLAGVTDIHQQTPELMKCAGGYVNSIKTWQNRASKAIKRNVGVVDCHAIHHWHGSKHRRGYGSRWKILGKHAFDPATDLFRDENGIYQLTDEKVGLRDDIRRYFQSRVEDDRQHFPNDRVIMHLPV